MNPQLKQIAAQVGDEVYDSVSHDHLHSLSLREIGEIIDSADPMLKVVWLAKWQGGYDQEFKFLWPEKDAEEHPEKLRDRMEHRLLREVYKEDTVLSVI